MTNVQFFNAVFPIACAEYCQASAIAVSSCPSFDRGELPTSENLRVRVTPGIQHISETMSYVSASCDMEVWSKEGRLCEVIPIGHLSCNEVSPSTKTILVFGGFVEFFRACAENVLRQLLPHKASAEEVLSRLVSHMTTLRDTSMSMEKNFGVDTSEMVDTLDTLLDFVSVASNQPASLQKKNGVKAPSEEAPIGVAACDSETVHNHLINH